MVHLSRKSLVIWRHAVETDTNKVVYARVVHVLFRTSFPSSLLSDDYDDLM